MFYKAETRIAQLEEYANWSKYLAILLVGASIATGVFLFEEHPAFISIMIAAMFFFWVSSQIRNEAKSMQKNINELTNDVNPEHEKMLKELLEYKAQLPVWKCIFS